VSEDEQVDIYDDTLRKVGVTGRLEAHKRGLWHFNFHCWIITHRSGGAVLFQIRSEVKPSFPGLLDSTVGGHYSAGEGLREVMREIEEEIGIKVRLKDLVPIGSRVDVAFYDGVSKREIAQVFFLEDDRPLTDYRLSAEEVVALMEVPVDAGLKLFSGPAKRIQAKGVRWVESRDEWEKVRMTLTQKSFVPKMDSYYRSLFVNAKRFLSGDKLLSI